MGNKSKLTSSKIIERFSYGCDCGQDKIQIRKGKTVAAAYVYSLCSVWSPFIFRTGFMGGSTKTGIRFYYIQPCFHRDLYCD